jgi:hypothetical protein
VPLATLALELAGGLDVVARVGPLLTKPCSVNQALQEATVARLDDGERGHKAYHIEQACAAECCSPLCAALLALFHLGLPRGSLRVKHSLGIVKLVTPRLPWPRVL